MINSIVKGSSVTLYEKTVIGTDEFGHDIYDEIPVNVSNVFIQPVSDDAIVNNIEVAGTHNSYVLHIPKKDTHRWEDSKVDLPSPYNVTVKTYSNGLIFREDLAPLDWNKQIKAEIYG
ncbi:MAG: hypothetical protein Q4A15_00450 [Prevotellaceae bacterium]|nr:hypothetical protein [Prevotellaceae bacterium]